MKELTDLLPIGSVVILKECTEPLMIIQNKKIIEDDKEYLYVGEPFPIGMIDSRLTRNFNQDEIDKVIFIGYVDSRIQRRYDRKDES